MDRSSNMFGQGWGKKALERAITLNQIKHDFSRASNWAVNPVWNAPDDGFLSDTINPGDIIYGDIAAGEVLQPINLNVDPRYALEAYNMERESAQKTFKLDAFDFQKAERQTTSEISEFASVRNVKVSRLVYRFYTEGLIPLLSSIYTLGRKLGLIQRPAILEGIELELDIISPLVAQQRYNKITNMQRSFQAVAPVLQIDPEARHMIDGKRAMADIFSEFGLAHMLRDVDEAQAKADEEKQAQTSGIESQSLKDSAEAERAAAQAAQLRSQTEE